MTGSFIPYNETSSNRKAHVFIGESLGARIDCIDGEQSYYVWPISGAHLGKDDRVLLDVYTSTKPEVLMGGSPIQTDVLEGRGVLTLLRLSDGRNCEKILEPGVRVNIPSDNVAYWYVNTGEGNLLLRNTCHGFDLAGKQLAEDVVRALVSLSTRAI